MKAAVVVATNQPWEIRELPNPKPQAGQVLIKIHASGMCGTDVHLYHGVFPAKLPIVAGHEPVGEIVELGAGVTHLKKGDRVGVSWNQDGCGRCLYCQQQRKKYCEGRPEGPQSWTDLGGGNSELMLAWAEGCTLLPEGLDYENAAPLFCAGFTIASGYFNANPVPGETIAVLGLGGLGHLAVQYAKAKGHPVIVLTRSANKEQLAKQLGADEVIVTQDDFGQALAQRGGADVILNTSSSMKEANQALTGLHPEGRLVCMGISDEALEISPMAIIGKQYKILGSMQNNRSDLVDILHLTAQGKIKPMLELYSLDDVNKALQRLIDGKVRFRAVIKYTI